MLDLHCCVGFSLVVVSGLLTVAASLVLEQVLGQVGSVVEALGLRSTGFIGVAHGLSCS